MLKESLFNNNGYKLDRYRALFYSFHVFFSCRKSTYFYTCFLRALFNALLRNLILIKHNVTLLYNTIYIARSIFAHTLHTLYAQLYILRRIKQYALRTASYASYFIAVYCARQLYQAHSQ